MNVSARIYRRRDRLIAAAVLRWCDLRAADLIDSNIDADVPIYETIGTTKADLRPWITDLGKELLQWVTGTDG